MEQWIFFALFLGFAVKIPMFPLHTWLPDAHTEAPTAGSVLLAALLLKMGTYGFLRFSLPLLPQASTQRWIVNLMVVLSLIGIIYGALVCLTQRDWKRLVAYSSISHLGFCTLGIFALNSNGLVGSVIQQVNHGITTGLLFLLVGSSTIAVTRARSPNMAEWPRRCLCTRLVVRNYGIRIRGPAAPEWVHRRIHHSFGRVPSEPMVGSYRSFRHHSGCCISSLAVSTHDARAHQTR